MRELGKRKRGGSFPAAVKGNQKPEVISNFFFWQKGGGEYNGLAGFSPGGGGEGWIIYWVRKVI